MTHQQIKAFLADQKKLRAIPEHENYSCCEEGHVWSTKHNWRGYGIRQLTERLSWDGYKTVTIMINGKKTNKKVHSLVCRTFHGPRNGRQVRHLDGNKSNNSPINLKWGNASENAIDRKIHGTCKAAENGRKSANKLKKNKALSDIGVKLGQSHD